MRGHSLIELLLVLALMGATTASLAPTALTYRDRASVRSAREALVGLLAQARLAAIERGEARVRVHTSPPTASALSMDSTLRTVRFLGDFGVELEIGAGSEEVDLRFNALGLGSMAAQTIRFSRGKAGASLVVSSYGRVRRR